MPSTHPNKTGSYFYFSKPERWAAFVLLVLIGMVMVLPKFLWQQKPDLLIPLALEQFGIDTMYMRDAYAEVALSLIHI